MKYVLHTLSFVIAVLLVSCGDDATVIESTESTPSNDGTFSYSLQFDAPYPHYDGEDVTRATDAGEWEDGDVVYIYLDTPNNAYAQATYKIQSNQWVLECDKKLMSNTLSDCTVWYGTEMEKPYHTKFLTSSFLCTDGMYSYNNGVVFIHANLKPYGRRLKLLNMEAETENSPSSRDIQIISDKDSFRPLVSISKNNKDIPFIKYSYSSASLYIKDCEETDYLVFDIGEDVRQLYLNYSIYNGTKNVGFYRYFDDHSLFYGESGVFTIPTIDNHRGWILGYIN